VSVPIPPACREGKLSLCLPGRQEESELYEAGEARVIKVDTASKTWWTLSAVSFAGAGLSPTRCNE